MESSDISQIMLDHSDYDNQIKYKVSDSAQYANADNSTVDQRNNSSVISNNPARRRRFRK